MKSGEKIERRKERYRRLRANLAGIGPILQGTITERTIVRGVPGARREEKTYGPYYQWTFKDKGKTRTVNLTAQQEKLFGRAIANQRRMDEIIKEMRMLSQEIFEAQTIGVKRRTTGK